MKRKWIYNLTGILFLVVAGCMYPTKKFIEKRLVIARNETVRINELDMSITNSGCSWGDYVGRVYCVLIVKTKDSTWSFENHYSPLHGESFSPLYIKNLKLVIDQTNPWDQEQDSIPPGGCRIIVTRLDDLSR
jgi:hypothetical protein